MGRVLQPFEYHEPTTVAEAAQLSAPTGSRLLAGGCGLVPSMRLGLVRPHRVISIMKVAELEDALRLDPDRRLWIGARVLLRELDRHNEDRHNEVRDWPALGDAIRTLEPVDIRNMGTVVGNVCSAVAFLDLPVVLTALGAEIHATDGFLSRTIPLAEFYTSPQTTALRPGELVSSIVVAAAGPNAGSAFGKIAMTPRRGGDLNRVSVACSTVLDPGKTTVVSTVVAIGGCDFRPLRVAVPRRPGESANAAAFSRAADCAAAALAPLTGALWADEARIDLLRALVRDGLERATDRARAAQAD